jgi:hypothetical protein
MPKELRSDRRDDIFKEYVIARIEKAGEKFEVLHKAELGGNGCRSTIAIAGGQLFIRTTDKLYCVGKRK